jgi:hypothetical protein
MYMHALVIATLTHLCLVCMYVRDFQILYIRALLVTFSVDFLLKDLLGS